MPDGFICFHGLEKPCQRLHITGTQHKARGSREYRRILFYGYAVLSCRCVAQQKSLLTGTARLHISPSVVYCSVKRVQAFQSLLARYYNVEVVRTNLDYRHRESKLEIST